MAHADYLEPYLHPHFTYEGCRIVWGHYEEPDLSRIVPLIRQHFETLRRWYKVDLDDSDLTRIEMTIAYKTQPERVDQLHLKGIVAVIMADTNWGGPG